AFRLPLDDVELALLGERAESEFGGARGGVVDQMAASLGVEGRALLIDTRSLEHRSVPLPAAAELLVIDSGVAHTNRAGGYNARRAECERACALLGVRALRDLAAADLPRAAALPDPLARRVRHVVGENERVRAALAALEAGDVVRLGALLDASHASLRDDYEVSTPEVDRLVEIARAQPETLGARLTGGGFGGAIVALVRRGYAAVVAARIPRGFTSQTGRPRTGLVPPPGAGGPVVVGVVPVVVLEDLSGVLAAGEQVDGDPRAALVLVRRELDHVHGEGRDPLPGQGGGAERRDVDMIVTERHLLGMMADG